MNYSDNEKIYRGLSRSKIVRSGRFTKPTVEQKEEKFITETFAPREVWKPFKLVNDRLGVAHTIMTKMGWTEIVKEVLRDNTPPSSICALVNGRYKTANGWRCEFL